MFPAYTTASGARPPPPPRRRQRRGVVRCPEHFEGRAARHAVPPPGMPGSGRRGDDLPPVVGAARRARGVRQLLVAARRALDQGRRGGLPLRTPVPRVAARLLPLGDGHVSPPAFLLVGRMPGEGTTPHLPHRGMPVTAARYPHWRYPPRYLPR